MFNIILYEPEIPFNTGAIIRLCANTGCRLHLIEPISFDLDDKKLRRTGLDYHEFASMQVYSSLQECLQEIACRKVYACTTKGNSRYSDVTYQQGDGLLFGPETRGLPDDVLNGDLVDNRIRIPMLKDSRSMNLANACSVIVYEAWRQQGFGGSTDIS